MVEHVFDRPSARPVAPGSRGAPVGEGGRGDPTAQVARPAGWPRAVPPAGVPGWERPLVAWLLDLCPPEYRAYPAIHRHPLLLAWLAERHVGAQLIAMREAYQVVRVEVGGRLPPGAVESVLDALRHEGRQLVATQRSIGLVRQALDGAAFVRRL